MRAADDWPLARERLPTKARLARYVQRRRVFLRVHDCRLMAIWKISKKSSILRWGVAVDLRICLHPPPMGPLGGGGGVNFFGIKLFV